MVNTEQLSSMIVHNTENRVENGGSSGELAEIIICAYKMGGPNGEPATK